MSVLTRETGRRRRYRIRFDDPRTGAVMNDDGDEAAFTVPKSNLPASARAAAGGGWNATPGGRKRSEENPALFPLFYRYIWKATGNWNNIR